MVLFSSAASTFSQADVDVWRFFRFSVRSRVSLEYFLAILRGVANSLAVATRGLTTFLGLLTVVSLIFPPSSSRAALLFWSLIQNSSTKNGNTRKGSAVWWNKWRLSLLVSILTLHLTIL